MKHFNVFNFLSSGSLITSGFYYLFHIYFRNCVFPVNVVYIFCRAFETNVLHFKLLLRKNIFAFRSCGTKIVKNVVIGETETATALLSGRDFV